MAALSVALAGCGGASDHTRSGFAPVSGGVVDKTFLGEANATVSDPAVGTVAMVTGHTYGTTSGPIRISYGTYHAYAGIAPGYDTGVPVAEGTASYDAKYAYLVVDDVYDGWFGISGNRLSRSGTIALTADFDGGTLTGADTGLTVDGAIRGGNLSGDVTMIFFPGDPSGSVGGTLTGYIGDGGTIGAFHGNDGDTVAAGGFVGAAN